MKIRLSASGIFAAEIYSDQAGVVDQVEDLVYPVYQRSSSDPPNIQVSLFGGQSADPKFLSILQSVDWSSHREGFDATVRVRHAECGELFLHQHESGDVIAVNRAKAAISVYSPAPAKVGRYVLLDAFSKWLQASGAVCMHASAVRLGEKVVVICGNKGSGKTSLAVELIKRHPDAAFIENDRVLWLGDSVYAGGTAISVAGDGGKVKKRGKDALSLLPPGTSWEPAGHLGAVVVLESGHQGVTLRPALAREVSLPTYVHDPWENWLHIYNSVNTVLRADGIPILRCEHGYHDEADVAAMLSVDLPWRH